jgi:hypothetical protein
MKQVIIEKLFNGEELESSEILEVTRSLNYVDGADIKPYNHQETKIFEACNVCEDDIQELNIKISDFSKDSVSVSEIVEHCEKLADLNSSYKRLIIIQAIKYMKIYNDPFLKMFLAL